MLIILKLTLPSLDGLLGADGEGMARTQVVGGLNRARQMALERGTPVYMVFMPLYGDVWPNPEVPQVKIENDFFNENHKRTYFSGDKGVNELLDSQLTSYAIYAEYLPGDQPGKPSTKWLTDWKALPAGYHFNRAELAGLPKIAVKYLKGSKPASATVGLGLPRIKFNSRGEIESLSGERELGGLYLSVSEGGVFPPEKNQSGSYVTINGDPPEAVAAGGRKWLHINGVTGRAEIKELSDEEAAAGMNLQNSEFELFIISSPQYPPDFHDSISNYQPIVNWVTQTGAKYNQNWRGPPDWDVAPDGKSYPSKTWPSNNVLTPAFTKLPNQQAAVRLKWYLEKLVGDNTTFVGRKVVVRIAHQQ